MFVADQGSRSSKIFCNMGQFNISDGFVKYIPFQHFIPFDLNKVIDDQVLTESKSGQVAFGK